MSDLGEPDDLDGCDIEFNDPVTNTEDGEQVTALVLYADVDWYDEDAVEARRVELTEWAAALRGDT
ncbi:MAG TPA: hypothetical protein VGW74_09275 [Propionibacteriaceae bacterium]|nr:hypothetical protein [Propionibacteriaceae bacterium]